MDACDVLLVDAFAAEPMAGTPTGVVLDAGELGDDQMAAIAGELGAGATAFVSASETADRRLRSVTPTGEVDWHDAATVAAHAALFERDGLAAGEYQVETVGRTRDVEVKPDGTVWVDQGRADIDPVDLDHGAVADALGIDVATLEDVGADMPMAVADTGEPWLLVPVNYFEHVSRVGPDVAAVATLCDQVDAVGLYVFTFDTIAGESTLHARAFRPEGGGEDPVTATAAGACAAHVRREGALDDTVEQVVVEQGHFLDRPGTVRVDTDGLETWVGGRAVTTMDGSMTVPEATGDDDIIEI